MVDGPGFFLLIIDFVLYEWIIILLSPILKLYRSIRYFMGFFLALFFFGRGRGGAAEVSRVNHRPLIKIGAKLSLISSHWLGVKAK